MEPQIRVTVEDLETHEVQAMEVADDYVIVTAGVCEITHVNTYPAKGTHVLTVKNAARGMQRDVSATVGIFTSDGVDRLIREVLLELRDEASAARMAEAQSYFRALMNLGALSGQRCLELQQLMLSCPGHEDDAGVRAWCAYCGDLEKDAEPGDEVSA